MKDKKEIENLYLKYSNEILKEDEELSSISKSLALKQEELLKSLSKEQSDLLKEVLELQTERSEKISRNSFIFSFSLATKLFTEGLK